MLKLTRLNHQTVAINPDHIAWVDSSPDTVLSLLGGEKILVRETLDELIAAVVEFRQRIRQKDGFVNSASDGDPPRVLPQKRNSNPPPRFTSDPPRRNSDPPRSYSFRPRNGGDE